MVSTGVVRKIDDLGRIVIPKEIRKNLGIRDGETLEIIVENDSIKLVKNNLLYNYIKEIENIIESAKEIIDGEIIVTDREKVILGGDSINKNELLSDKLLKIIDGRISFCDDNIELFLIGNKEIRGYFLIIPIIADGNSIGLIIVYNKEKKVKEYYSIVKFISSLLARKMDIAC